MSTTEHLPELEPDKFRLNDDYFKEHPHLIPIEGSKLGLLMTEEAEKRWQTILNGSHVAIAASSVEEKPTPDPTVEQA